MVAKLAPEQEEDLINRIAGGVAKFKLEVPATIILEAIRPVSYVASNVVILPAAPYLELFGIHGYQYVSFFEKRKRGTFVKKIEERVK